MPRITNYLSQVENVVTSSTTENYPDYWQENHITFDILKGLKKVLKNAVIEKAANNLYINWRIFKQERG